MQFLNLNENTRIPILGFGTWKLSGDICQKSVEKALEVGFRHIDTADKYGNHHEVGEAIKSSLLKREDLFITTKIWPTNLKRDSVITCGETFLKELQLEFHPSLNQRELVEYCKQNQITVTAYSPNAQGQDLKIAEIQIMATKYGKTESQIILKWIITKGIAAIPRSDKDRHIEENFQIWDWELDDADMKIMDNLNSDNRLTNPDFAEFSY